MNSCSQAKQAAQERFKENQRLFQETCDGISVTPAQLLQILRTVPDYFIEQPVGQVVTRLTEISAKHGGKALSSKCEAIRTTCQNAQIKPSALAAVTEGAIALEVVENRNRVLRRHYPLLATLYLRWVAPQSARRLMLNVGRQEQERV